MGVRRDFRDNKVVARLANNYYQGVVHIYAPVVLSTAIIMNKLDCKHMAKHFRDTSYEKRHIVGGLKWK